jgi:hypothetical protein
LNPMQGTVRMVSKIYFPRFNRPIMTKQFTQIIKIISKNEYKYQKGKKLLINEEMIEQNLKIIQEILSKFEQVMKKVPTPRTLKLFRSFRKIIHF